MVLRCGLHGPREVGVDTPPVRIQVAATGEILEIEYENLHAKKFKYINTYYGTVLIQPEQKKRKKTTEMRQYTQILAVLWIDSLMTKNKCKVVNDGFLNNFFKYFFCDIQEGIPRPK
jgi:hypothetical protein